MVSTEDVLQGLWREAEGRGGAEHYSQCLREGPDSPG